MAYEFGDVGVARLAETAERDELHVVSTCPLDRSAGDQALAIRQQNDLEHDAWVIGAGTDFIILESRIENGEIEFVIDQVV